MTTDKRLQLISLIQTAIALEANVLSLHGDNGVRPVDDVCGLLTVVSIQLLRLLLPQGTIISPNAPAIDPHDFRL